MADNVTFQAGLTATPAKDTVVAADDIGGVLYQRMKLVHGSDGNADADVSKSSPLPVDSGYDYSLFFFDGDGKIEYLCRHPVHGTATSATDWKITKFTYDGSGNLTRSEKLPGSVDGKDALGWV